MEKILLSKPLADEQKSYQEDFCLSFRYHHQEKYLTLRKFQKNNTDNSQEIIEGQFDTGINLTLESI